MFPFQTYATLNVSHGQKNPLAPGKYVGMNWSLPMNTPIFSLGSGVVVFADWAKNLDVGPFFSTISPSAGIIVIIESQEHAGVYFVYCHLNETILNAGDCIYDGQEIGKSGSTGLTTGPTFSLVALRWANKLSAKPIDPAPFLGPHRSRKRIKEATSLYYSFDHYGVLSVTVETEFDTSYELDTKGFDLTSIETVGDLAISSSRGRTYLVPNPINNPDYDVLILPLFFAVHEFSLIVGRTEKDIIDHVSEHCSVSCAKRIAE